MLQRCLPVQSKPSCYSETKCCPRMAEKQYSRWKHSSKFGLATVILLALLSAAAPPVNGAPLPQDHTEHIRSEQHRLLCLHYATHNAVSCNFHASCIESLFPCGNKGFALSYAQNRCGHVRKFHQSTSNCPYCFHHQELVDWALDTEKCLQSELAPLARQFVNKMASRHPDPPECLLFEREALEKLTVCYQRKKSSLCQLIGSSSGDKLNADLSKLVHMFTSNEYYAAAVQEQLKEMLQSCRAEEAIFQAVFPSQPIKIRFCAALTTPGSVNLVEQIARKLKRSREEFVFAGRGDVDHNGEIADQAICRDKAPSGMGALLEGYQIIQWSPQPNDTKPAELKLNHRYTIAYSARTEIWYYVYSNDANNSRACGNGRREAGELCDVFANTGMNRFGCDLNCMPFAGYECSLAQLENSTCQPTRCGDGRRTTDEECDTGGSSEGCSSSCHTQPGYVCTQNSYNTTSVCEPVPSTPSTAPPPPTTSQQQSALSHSPSPSQPSPSQPSRSSSPVSPKQFTSSSASSQWRTQSLWSGLLPVCVSVLIGQAFLLTHR